MFRLLKTRAVETHFYIAVCCNNLFLLIFGIKLPQVEHWGFEYAMYAKLKNFLSKRNLIYST